LGVSKDWAFVDCCGLSDDLLDFIPQPCIAVLFLFPYKQTLKLKSDEKTGDDSKEKSSSSLYFMKQLVSNACGSIAVLHSLANNQDKVTLNKEGALHSFLTRTGSMSAAERGLELGLDDGITAAHKKSGKKGQTRPEDHQGDDFHFVCFVQKDGLLYQLDGMKATPIAQGECGTGKEFLKKTAEVVQKEYMDKMPGELFFSFITLGPSDSATAADAQKEDEVVVSQTALAEMVSMGFDQNKSTTALRACNNNVENAIAMVLSM